MSDRLAYLESFFNAMSVTYLYNARLAIACFLKKDFTLVASAAILDI